MINKMESSCCHGNLKRSGQAQARAENGLIGKDTDDWGLNHKGLPVPPLIRLRVWAWGGRMSSMRTQHYAAAVPQACGSALGDVEEGGAAETGGAGRERGETSPVMGKSRGCRALINSL